MNDGDLIKREDALRECCRGCCGGSTHGCEVPCPEYMNISNLAAVDAVDVVQGFFAGDVCFYGYAPENKSLVLVEIVKVLEDERGIAEIKVLKVFNDDSGNGWFDYLCKTGNTMNASFKYMRNITPERRSE